jgi:hypothetical protein
MIVTIEFMFPTASKILYVVQWIGECERWTAITELSFGVSTLINKLTGEVTAESE